MYSQFRCVLRCYLWRLTLPLHIQNTCSCVITSLLESLLINTSLEIGLENRFFSVVICLEERRWFLYLLQLSLMVTDTCKHSLTKSFLETVRALISWFPVESSIGVFQLCSSESQNSKVGTQRWLWDKKGDFRLFTSVSEGRAQTFYLFDMSEFYLMFCLKNSKGNGLLQLLKKNPKLWFRLNLLSIP